MNPIASASISSRRRVLASIGSIAATLAALPRAQAQEPSTPANQNRTSIHYDIDFKSSPQRLYQAITDQKQFAAFTGLPATIDATPGGAFSQFGGLIGGRNVELVPNQRIVQAWRPSHWDPGIYSIAHFEFNPRGAKTSLAFDHIGFPAGDYDSLDSGWHEHYWEPLRKFLS